MGNCGGAKKSDPSANFFPARLFDPFKKKAKISPAAAKDDRLYRKSYPDTSNKRNRTLFEVTTQFGGNIYTKWRKIYTIWRKSVIRDVYLY